MPFIRVHGNQLALVHGSRRDGKVVQEVLFTLYSKAEAREALGQGNEGGAYWFERLLTDQYPKISFSWTKIREEIASKLDHLPDAYDHPEVRLKRDFREALVSFARQLLLCDPQDLDVAAEVLNEQGDALHALQDWLTWRLKMARERKPSEYTKDNPFLWKYQGLKRDVPHEADDLVHTLYEEGKYDEVIPRAKLLVEAFPNYADGFNLLGLVALEREEIDEAIGYFQKTAEVGRTLFPKRIPKDAWWSDHSTRPYMRGLGNLAIAFNRSGRFDEAFSACDTLALCHDPIRVNAHRGPVLLNLGRYEEAAECLKTLTGLWAREGFSVAFALLSQGKEKDALPFLLRAIFNHPRHARLLVGSKVPKARNRHEWEDDRAFWAESRDLHAWLSRDSRKPMAYVRQVVRHPRVQELVQEIDALDEQDRRERTHEVFVRLQAIKSVDFAEKVAREVEL